MQAHSYMQIELMDKGQNNGLAVLRALRNFAPGQSPVPKTKPCSGTGKVQPKSSCLANETFF
jgi:hypothetical protein